MKNLCLGVSLVGFWPGVALAEVESGRHEPNQAITVTGAGLPLPPGTPAYGSVTIGRERLTDDASGRVENVLRDVAGFAQFRRSDSRPANPTAQAITLRALGGNASRRSTVMVDGGPSEDPLVRTSVGLGKRGAVGVEFGGGGINYTQN